MTKFGVCLPLFAGSSAKTSEINITEIINFAKKSEELGYSSLWGADHFHLGHEKGEHEIWTILSMIAQQTKQIRMGPLVLGYSHRNPALLAKMTSTLDFLSSGRFDLGIGAGWYKEEQNAYGFDWIEKVGIRMDAFEEYIEIILNIFKDHSHSDYTHFSIPKTKLSPNLTQKPYPPLLIGGGGEKRTLKLVAKYADIWNIPSVPPIEYSRKLSVLKSHCENLGTNYSRIEKTMESRILITDKGINDEIIDWFRYFLKTADQVVPTRQESKEIIESNFMIGSLDECKEKISNYIEEGVNSYASMFQITYKPYQGLHLLAKYDYFDKNYDIKDGSVERKTIGFEIYPLNMFEVSFQHREYALDSIVLDGKINTEYLVQIHTWF